MPRAELSEVIGIGHNGRLGRGSGLGPGAGVLVDGCWSPGGQPARYAKHLRGRLVGRAIVIADHVVFDTSVFRTAAAMMNGAESQERGTSIAGESISSSLG